MKSNHYAINSIHNDDDDHDDEAALSEFDTSYIDYSRDIDPDPLTPLTPVGHVPTFPAKLHAILSRKDLSDIICWMPHGRSWKVMNPTEFLNSITPQYFGHTKYSSFQRQANVWGFRRITRGIDVDSYCHPLFLRGLPHLCKRMKRCGSKISRTPRRAFDEVDLYRFSQMYPVPTDYNDDSVLLPCIIEGGPKARISLSKRDSTNPAPKLSDFNDPKVTSIDQMNPQRSEDLVKSSRNTNFSSDQNFKLLPTFPLSESCISSIPNELHTMRCPIETPSTNLKALADIATERALAQQQEYYQRIEQPLISGNVSIKSNKNIPPITPYIFAGPLSSPYSLLSCQDAMSLFAAGFATASAISSGSYLDQLPHPQR